MFPKHFQVWLKMQLKKSTMMASDAAFKPLNPPEKKKETLWVSQTLLVISLDVFYYTSKDRFFLAATEVFC